jgi:hypothetical protein
MAGIIKFETPFHFEGFDRRIFPEIAANLQLNRKKYVSLPAHF